MIPEIDFPMEEIFSPAMEMVFANIRTNIVYSSKHKLPLPNADEQSDAAKGCLLISLAPTQEATIQELQRDYIGWYKGGYKLYTTDSIFKEKIGRKRLTLNMNKDMRSAWSNYHFNHPLRYVPYNMRKTKLADRPNLILDLGMWTKFYFQYSYKVANPVIVQNFVKFLQAKLNDPTYEKYGSRILYIPLNHWFATGKKLSFKREGLDNPVSILLFAAYRYEELFQNFPKGMTFLFVDSQNDQFIRYELGDFTKKMYPKIKARFLQMVAFRNGFDEESEKMLDIEYSKEEEDENSDFNNEGPVLSYPDPTKVIEDLPTDATEEEKARVRLKQQNRARLINEAKRNLVGSPSRTKNLPQSTPSIPTSTEATRTETPIMTSSTTGKKRSSKVVKVGDTVIGQTVEAHETVEDLTRSDEIYDHVDIGISEEDYDPITIDDDEDLDDDVIVAVDDTIRKMQENDPDVLLNANGELTAAQVNAAVQAQIKKSFLPQKSKEQEEKEKKLLQKQRSVIRKPTTAQEAKSKIIKVNDVSDAVDTMNESLKSVRHANFDKCYNEQKLQQDIDNAVAVLSRADTPVYVIDKKEEDTSDQLNLKKTITYTLEDVYGGKHIIKVDVPIIIENNYVYINGSRVLLGHQQLLMPIVKVKPNSVQIVSWYKKLTINRMGSNDTRMDAVKQYMVRNAELFDITPGNAMNRNTGNGIISTIDIDMYARNFTSFTIGDCIFVLDRLNLDEELRKVIPNYKPSTDSNQFPVGFDRSTKEVIYVTQDNTLTNVILEKMNPQERGKIAKMTKQTTRKILRSVVDVNGKAIPLALLLFFYEGFTEVMKKADIDYNIIKKAPDMILDYNKSDYNIIELADSYIVWERNPIWNTMLMNGLAGLELNVFTYKEMDERETFANLIANYFGSKNVSMSLLQFYDFMIDPVTEEILEDMGYPTDLVSLLLVANKMLADNSFTPVNTAQAIRIRSNEIIAQLIYQDVVNAYKSFRATEYKANLSRKRPDRIAIKQGNAIKRLISESALSNEASDMNPIHTMEKMRAITPKGPSGINKARAMTLAKRSYDKSMLGITGITTSNDANVGIVRQMTLEPNITSVRGYLQSVESDEELNSMSNAQLLSPSELLSPPGVLHDDGPRTAMSFKQTQYMVPTDGACPVWFGNKVEEVIPYHLDRQFCIVAKEDGVVEAIQDGIIVVKYKDGSHDSVDTNPQMKKNSSGFFIKMEMTSHLTKVGQKFKKNEVIGYNPRAFTKNDNDLSASMNIGVPVKMCIMANYDIYEDAAPITQSLSEKFTTHMSMKSGVGVPAASYVQQMVDIGDVVEVGDPLIVFDPAHDDEESNAFIDEIRDKLDEDLLDVIDLAAMPQVRADYPGTIVSIEVYSTVPASELSPSLQKIYKKHTAHSHNVNKLLDQFKNDNDLNYYKCGQHIKNAREIVKVTPDGRVKGFQIGDDNRGLVIIFYIEFKDIAKTGDKGSVYTALKFTTSHVIPKGMEPYSEYRPEEEISSILSPLSILARKTPSIWITMAANKCLIEMTRHALDIYYNDGDGKSP